MNLTDEAKLKMNLLANGIAISDKAQKILSDGEHRPFILHEFATTGGVTLVLPGGNYVNAPVQEWFCRPEYVLDYKDKEFCLTRIVDDNRITVEVLKLPAYVLSATPPRGIMSHADRIRLWPIRGCSFSCAFCDSHLFSYEKIPIPELMEGFSIALEDKNLPPKHVLVSGGTPKPEDVDWLLEVCDAAITASPLPVDVMIAPRYEYVVPSLVDMGVSGLSLNIEIWSDEVSGRYCSEKSAIGKRQYLDAIETAVELLGGDNVRSLFILGLEPLEDTLKGVEAVASLGASPVLSPFRPAQDTLLAGSMPLSFEELMFAYGKANAIAEKYGVVLGPHCIPCQHNTLTIAETQGG